MELPAVGPVGPADQDCLCSHCLTEAIAEANVLPKPVPDISDFPASSEPSLVEGEDFYMEGAAMVFTAKFLSRRGYCCESGCRHCPYA